MCLFASLLLFGPRLILLFIWLLTNWLSLAYQTTIWPLLGFLFMPFTTLAYMAGMLNNNGSVSGIWLVLLVVAVLFDLSQSATMKTKSSK
jgi:hypothetical protein